MTNPTFNTWQECHEWAKAETKTAQKMPNHNDRRERVQFILNVKRAHLHLKGQNDD